MARTFTVDVWLSFQRICLCLELWARTNPLLPIETSHGYLQLALKVGDCLRVDLLDLTKNVHPKTLTSLEILLHFSLVLNLSPSTVSEPLSGRDSRGWDIMKNISGQPFRALKALPPLLFLERSRCCKHGIMAFHGSLQFHSGHR